MALVGVAFALLMPFGVRFALDAVEGVGYLDEPAVARLLARAKFRAPRSAH